MGNPYNETITNFSSSRIRHAWYPKRYTQACRFSFRKARIKDLKDYPTYTFLFSYYDYKKIPEKTLEWFLKVKTEVYRSGYAVLFKWEGDITDALMKEHFFSFLSTLEEETKYRYVYINKVYEEDHQEDGVMSTFRIQLITKIEHLIINDIDNCKLKHDLNLLHSDFDIRIKNE